ncbi:MAG TPA: NrfD/PsrC family molybdoenzyme membrane anchor subunit [Longimicrobiales bacterium]|nr:NrfD/PsrC family molybdoenzyme membrane anchor subunit [Longimicrobiales bacterium]
MIQNVFSGSKRYWAILAAWAVLVAVGAAAYSVQFTDGLTVTGMSRDVSWGLYIAQFTFMVGIAASAVMVVLPYYLHDYKAFGRTVILGEFLAVSAVLVCMLFIFVDMGQPRRIVNVFLHPRPSSPMFWDSVVLFGYLILNLVIATVTIEAERQEAPPPRWVRPLIYLSIPWAVSIHTVTAFLYAGLGARPFWMTAILAPRFLASAFASGPSLLILLALIVRRFGGFDVGHKAVRTLATIVTYAMVINVFFVLVELFTALYSAIPHDVDTFAYLFTGLEGHSALTAWTWVGDGLAVVCTVLLVVPAVRRQERFLVPLCAGVIMALWIEKGLALVVAGFIPSPLGMVTEYAPTVPEVLITVGVYAVGGFVLTALYKVVLSVRGRLQSA